MQLAPTTIPALLVVLAIAALIIVLLRAGRVRGHLFYLLATVAVGGSSLWALAAWRPAPPIAAADSRPLEAPKDGYVSSAACRSCHADEYASWHASYHRSMTQAATPQTVLAPFDGRSIEFDRRRWVLERRGDEFWAEIDDLDWQGAPEHRPRIWRQIVQTTGSHHFQFYWYATGRGRELAILHVQYSLLGEARWMPLDACCISPPSDRYEAGFGRWSWNCVRCHATGGRPRIGEGYTIDTEVAELGIACEACHGPGAEHVAANRDPLRRYALHDSEEGDPTIINSARLSPKAASMICGNCHSVNLHRDEAERKHWNEHGYRYRPGGDWTEWRDLITTGEDRFWSDGAIRVSGREYNGLVDTPCFQRGEMSCMSCHLLHKHGDDPRPLGEWNDDQLKPDMRSNLACTGCHPAFADAAALTAHTHHAAESTGSSCYDCHMPYTTYGLLKAIRSHRLDSPDTAASVATGRPNACNQCHLDRPLGWAAEWLEQWYGIAQPELRDVERSVAAGVVWTLEGEAGQRALMAWSMGWEPARAVSGSDWMTPYLVLLMNDDYIAVRYIARRSFAKQERAGVELGDYDFTRASTAGFNWMMTSVTGWRSPATEAGSDRSRFLIGADGALDIMAVDAFLKRRDKRPITLNE